MSAEALRERIREIPDFPKPGILFYDITTLLKDPGAYKESIDLMLEPYKLEQVDVVVGMESRGFIFSAPMAYQLDAGRSEEHTSELQSQFHLVCRLLLEKKKKHARHLVVAEKLEPRYPGTATPD